MEVCKAEYFNATLGIEQQDICPNEDFLWGSNTPTNESLHSLPCYAMEQFNKSDILSMILVNSTELMTHLGSHKAGMCAVVLFYASWCPFSIKMALFYNALGRLYPDIPMFAVKMNTQVYGFAVNQPRYGVVAVPNLLIFQNQRAIGRYNESEPTVPKMIDFLSKFMNLSEFTNPSKDCLQHNKTSDSLACNITSYFQPIEQDYEGPIPIKLEEHTDWLLLVSICFLVAVVYSKYMGRLL